MIKTNEFLIVHHSAVSYNSNPNQFDAINRYHVGKGWGKIGYQYLIEKDGTVKQGRLDSEVGAHCYQENMNYRSIGICLTGWFDSGHDPFPTDAQWNSLIDLLAQKVQTYSIPIEHIKGHRDYAPKTCPGQNIDMERVREAVKNVIEHTMTTSEAVQFISEQHKKKFAEPTAVYMIVPEWEKEYLVKNNTKLLVTSITKTKDIEYMKSVFGVWVKPEVAEAIPDAK